MPDLPFKAWPKGPDAIDTAAGAVKRMYENGFAGCDLRAKSGAAANELFEDTIRAGGGWPIGDDPARLFGIEGRGENKLAVNFPDVLKLWPDALPGPAQQRGDCVSFSQRTADMVTIAVEINRGWPDEITGLVDGVPDIPLEGQRNGCFSTEWSYWHRGYKSDGWSCSSSARVSTVHGCMIRKAYSDELDLTTYSGQLAGRYGRRPPPDDFESIGRKHLPD